GTDGGIHHQDVQPAVRTHPDPVTRDARKSRGERKRRDGLLPCRLPALSALKEVRMRVLALRAAGLVLPASMLEASLLANTYTVTTTADSGVGSLRQAIL